MELNEIITLINAGYTKEDIAAMGEVKTPESSPVQAPEPTTEPKQVDTDDVNAELMEQIKAMSATISNLTTTVKALQENNQKTATIPEKSSNQTTEEIIKGFIENM